MTSMINSLSLTSAITDKQNLISKKKISLQADTKFALADATVKPVPVAKAGDPVEAKEIPVPPRKPLDPGLFDLMRKYFEAGDKRADVDHNGNINVNDFMAFLNSYAAGINPFEQPPVLTTAKAEKPEKPPVLTAVAEKPEKGPVIGPVPAKPLLKAVSYDAAANTLPAKADLSKTLLDILS